MSSRTSEPESEPTSTRTRPTLTEEKTTTERPRTTTTAKRETTTTKSNTTTTEERETTTTKPTTTTTTTLSTTSKMSYETTTTDPLITTTTTITTTMPYTTTTDPVTTTATILPTTTATTTTAWTTTTTVRPTTTTTTTTTPTTTTTTTWPVTTTTTLPLTKTTRTRTTRTRPPPTSLTTATLSTGTSDPYTATDISSISSSTSGGPIVSPTFPPAVNQSSMSTGAVVGIVVAALLAILAALIAAFMIKRRRRQVIHRTSNTLFNPVNLDMQEASSRYPSGPNGGGNGDGGYGTSSGYFQRLNGRESVEPLNAAMLGASGISAASGMGHSDVGTLYPYESDPRYFRRGSTVLPPTEEGDASGAMMGYGPTRMDPAYLAYAGAYGQQGDQQQHDPQDDEAYMRYQQQLYQQQLQQDPHHPQDLQAPVAYYDPTSGEIYYPEYTPDQQQGYATFGENRSPRAVDNAQNQQYLLSPSSPHDPHTLPGMLFMDENDDEAVASASSSPPAAAAAAAAARRVSDTAMSSSSTYVDTESDAHNHSKSAWPAVHRSSLLSNTSSSAGNRNPQGLANQLKNGSTIIKVPVPEEAETPPAS